MEVRKVILSLTKKILLKVKGKKDKKGKIIAHKKYLLKVNTCPPLYQKVETETLVYAIIYNSIRSPLQFQFPYDSTWFTELMFQFL